MKLPVHDKWSRSKAKNCLVTHQPENSDYIYFGIARCKLSVDNFRKVEGRNLAVQRMKESVNMYSKSKFESSTGQHEKSDFYLQEGGMRGVVHIRYIRTLLKHFETLED